jgi:hypothetical protein
MRYRSATTPKSTISIVCEQGLTISLFFAHFQPPSANNGSLWTDGLHIPLGYTVQPMSLFNSRNDAVTINSATFSSLRKYFNIYGSFTMT